MLTDQQIKDYKEWEEMVLTAKQIVKNIGAQKTTYTIMIGNPVDGFECWGIFETREDAIRYANQDSDINDSWVVMQINLLDGN